MNNPIQRLAGREILKGPGRECFKCGKVFKPDDEVAVVPAETGDGIEAEFGDCIDCAEKKIAPHDREAGFDQYIIKFRLKDSNLGLVYDEDGAEILDHSPPDDGTRSL